MILIFSSCVSEEEPVVVPVSNLQQAVEDAKEWFGPQEEFVVPVKSGVNTRVRNQIKKVHWDKVIVHEEGRVIEVAISYNTTAVPIRSAKTINDIKKKKKDAFFRLILVKRETGGFDKFILKYFPENTVGNQRKLEVNNYAVWSKGFSGDIQMISWDEELTTGWYVEQGEKVYTYFLKSNLGKKSRSTINAALNCTPLMEEVCFNWGDDEGEITCGGGYCDIPEFGVECYDIIAYEDPHCSDQYNPGSGPGYYTGPGNGGGGGSGNGSGGNNGGNLPTLYPEDQIINNVLNPCIGDAVDNAIDAAFKDEITQLVLEVFGASEEFNIEIVDVSDIESSVDGRTYAMPQGNGLLFDIELNKNTLSSSSKEYITATVFHELLHAYLAYLNIDSFLNDSQHINMANVYIDRLSESLTERYNISEQDAINLSWGGLGMTSAWSNLSSSKKAQINSTNQQYKTAQKGTSCN